MMFAIKGKTAETNMKISAIEKILRRHQGLMCLLQEASRRLPNKEKEQEVVGGDKLSSNEVA